MKVEIITPEACLYKGEASAVKVPSKQGPFTMLEHHAPIVAILVEGEVVLTDLQNKKHEFAIHSGFCEQHENQIIICCER